MAKHPGDDGNWNQDAAAPVPMSIKERIDTQLGVTSPAVVQAMRDEEAFVRGVADAWPKERFTDRRTPPDRRSTKPTGADRKADPRGGAYITQRD